METKSREEWLGILRENDVPSAPVMSRQEFIEHPQVIHNGMRVEVEDPELGPTIQMGVPIRMSDTPGSITSPAPVLGQHADELQSGLWQSEPRHVPGAVSASRKTNFPSPPLAGVRLARMSLRLRLSLVMRSVLLVLAFWVGTKGSAA